MNETFAGALDDLISEHLENGTARGDIIAELAQQLTALKVEAEALGETDSAKAEGRSLLPEEEKEKTGAE